MTTESKYEIAIRTLQSEGGCAKLHAFAERMNVSTALTTVLVNRKWLSKSGNSNGWNWTGPVTLDKRDIKKAIAEIREYGRNRKKLRYGLPQNQLSIQVDNPSPVVSAELKKPLAMDIHKTDEYHISVLWGLFTFKIKR